MTRVFFVEGAALEASSRAAFELETAELAHARVRIIATMGTAIFATFIGLRFALAPEDIEATMVVRVVTVLVSLGLVAATHVPAFKRGTYWISTALFTGWVAYLEFLVNAGSAVEPRQFHALMMLVPMWAMLVPMKGRHCALLTVVGVVGHFIGFRAAEQLQDTVQMVDELAMLAAGGVVSVIGSSMSLKLRRANFDARAQIEHEKKRSEDLLLNMLPRGIAKRLMNSERGIADGFKEVSILFADVCDFTELSAKLEPQEVVGFLNAFFSMADELAAAHGMEKIKTIGDAYMVAAGLPEARPDHAEALAAFALALREEFDTIEPIWGHKLQLRMGMNSGPVVAGVIGRTKFSYDLWGDTVNVAARMESHGLPGVIAMPEAFAMAIKTSFVVRQLKVVEVKGKGTMSIWTLVSHAPTEADDGR